MVICANCLAKATSETQSEVKTFALLTEIAENLEMDLDTTSRRNSELVSIIMHRLAVSQSSVLDAEIQSELKTSNTPQTLKSESSPLQFLSKPNKSAVLIKTLFGFAKLDAKTEFECMSYKKLYALCTAYEAILSIKNSSVTTAPAVMRNLMLYKTTHDRQLLETVGAPSGGKHSVLNKIMNTELPKLLPPANDFCSTDDNLQVKRVTSSSKLKENFKHTVKVVNSHVIFQNSGDKGSHILKNKDNQPKKWLKMPNKSDIDVFEKTIATYEREARKVRSVLAGGWLSEMMKELKEDKDPVAKLTRLRRSMPERHLLYPYQSCDGEGIYSN